jgi:vancomycin aglycone glucosyltransferase
VGKDVQPDVFQIASTRKDCPFHLKSVKTPLLPAREAGMKVLISSIGSRGDVQPILALAVRVQALGHQARLCVAPNFKEWVESFGVECIPIGPDLKQLTGGTAPKKPVRPSEEQRRQLAAHSVRSQFTVLTEAARGCDRIVAGGALQIATRSVAEALGIPYVFTAYCPAVLPSPDHPPPKMETHHAQSLPAETNASLWAEEEQRWNDLFCDTLNEERAKLNLAPVHSVQRHIFTDHPWLAADPTLGPAGATAGGMQIEQTGAWLLDDPHPLPDEVEAFLAQGEPPVYFGFGSMRASEDASRVLIGAARALGLRLILSRGWANLNPIDGGADCLSVGDVAHEKLLPRVAAVVHHGGAGTTTVAARAGIGQIVVPRLYDQYYWAHRVQQLGIGVIGPSAEDLTVTAMTSAIRECMRPGIVERARSLVSRIELRGVQRAAVRLFGEP